METTGEKTAGAGGVSVLDRRGRRLVTLRVPVAISDLYGLHLEGYSTGVNERGLAGRFDYVEGPWPAEWLGHEVRVVLTVPGRHGETVAFRGRLLRLEGSWVPDRRYFLSLRFHDAEPGAVEALRSFVAWREDRYFTDEKPVRLWYIHSEGRGEQFGPLTTDEVLASQRSGGITIKDQIWDAGEGAWVPFALPAFQRMAGITTARRRALRRLAITSLLLAALGSFGYLEGWLDYSAPARLYRDAMVQVSAGRETMARTLLADVARLHPGTSWAQRAQEAGELLREREEEAKATRLAGERLREFLAMPEDRKSAAAVRSNIGDCYYKLGQFEAARQWLHSAVVAGPALSRPHYNLGTVYLRLGQPGEAARWLTRAAELMRNRPEIHVNLGVAHLAQGKRAEAEQEFQLALSLQPDNREVRAAVARARGTSR